MIGLLYAIESAVRNEQLDIAEQRKYEQRITEREREKRARRWKLKCAATEAKAVEENGNKCLPTDALVRELRRMVGLNGSERAGVITSGHVPGIGEGNDYFGNHT